MLPLTLRRIGAILLLASSWLTAAERPLNIILLYADDWRFDTLGVAGDPVVQTPEIDRLAQDGVRFTQAGVTTSICWVSRASLLTGQWMSRHGNTTSGSLEVNWAETYPGLLRERGYYVGHVGKWHNGAFPAEHYDFGRSYYGTHWMKEPNGSMIHVTQKNERDAMEFLRTRPADQPFCLTVAFFATHAEDRHPLQYLPQPESMALYDGVEIPVPVNATDESFRRLPPFLANERNEARVRWHWRFDSPGKYQSMMKNYFRLATEVDAVCGRLRAELERQGVLENTLVIFTGDNGYYHGEHGLADKWYPHQESIRVPLIVWDPRLPAAQRGSTRDELTLNVDLTATMLAAAGVPEPAAMQGRDLAPLYLEASPPAWREQYFYEHPVVFRKDFIPSSQALVQRDWKYFYWPDYDLEQLFDLRSDPHEEHDLATDAAYAERLAELRAAFAQAREAAR